MARDFFFIGLFVVVGALKEVGVILAVARWALDVTGGADRPLRHAHPLVIGHCLRFC